MSFTKFGLILLLIGAVCANHENKSYQLSDDVEVFSNGHKVINEARGEKNLEDSVLGFVQSHDVKVKLIGAVCAKHENKSYQLSDDVEVFSNGHKVINEARGEKNLEDSVLGFVQSHDVKVKLPLEAAATVSARDIDSGVLNFKLKLSSSEVDEGRGKKKKIKKVVFPIIALLLLKAITVLPLILGVSLITATNAINFGFVTFVASFAVGMYELYKKFASNQPPPVITHIAAHDHHDHHDYHWDHHRSFDGQGDAQQMAYSAYH